MMGLSLFIVASHLLTHSLTHAELYAELISKRYYAAFAWALLNAIVDLDASPPRFRKPKLMKGLVSDEDGQGSNMEAVSGGLTLLPCAVW
jgi:hypothetical protein